MSNDRKFVDALSRLTSDVYGSERASSEAEWHSLWQTADVSHHDPLVIALLGGALADRLDWVFHAGYQGMMRYAFPFCPGSGWASYLVAEDKTGEFPGTVVTKTAGHTQLSGCKSWVAGVEHVDHLIVRVSGTDDEVFLVVPAHGPGVVLSSREKPGFLSDLSQGFATFEDVVINDDQLFARAQLHQNFAYAEAFHVLVALNAFMVSHTLRVGGDADILLAATQSLSNAGDLIESGAVDDDFFLGTADLDVATTHTAELFEMLIEHHDVELFQRWQRSRGVVNMFSRGLQKRAKWMRDY